MIFERLHRRTKQFEAETSTRWRRTLTTYPLFIFPHFNDRIRLSLP